MTTPSQYNPVLSPARRRRGIFSLIASGLKWLGITLLALIIIGLVYQWIASAIDQRNILPPGQSVVVDGHRMHINCAGTGSPVVILEAGGYSFSAEWDWVQQQLAPTQRVCAYDRAGDGWSEPGPAPRTAQRIVGELHSLLATAHIPGPYILAGHSFGGLLNRVYASQYPDEVAGIVLVDTAFPTPQFADANDYQEWKRSNDLLNAPIWALTRIGVARMLNASAFQGYGYSAQAAAQLTALRSSNQAFDTYYAEGIAVASDNQSAFAAAEHIGDRPLMILWATVLPRKLTPAEESRLASLQQGVGSFSSNSETRFIEGADHGSIIGNETYARQVTQAILDVIRAVQKGEKLVHP